MEFKRWGHKAKHSLPYMLFKQYNEELSDFLWANESAHKFVYKWLGKHGAKMTDEVRKHLQFSPHVWNFQTIKDWSNSFNESQNWFYLNCVIAMSANLETFMDCIISLAIESDPGVLLHASKSIDGTSLLKSGISIKDSYELKAVSCTKGTWSTRKKAFNDIFGSYPLCFDEKESTLDRMRLLRNKIAHAFGRDIDDSRNFKRRGKLPQEHITLQRVKNWLECVSYVACGIDTFLMDKHIGEFESIVALHEEYPNLQKYLSSKEKAMAFRKKANMLHIGKDQSIALVEYYKGVK